MKTSEIEAIVNSLVDDRLLLGHVYCEVKASFNGKHWKTVPHFNDVINNTIDKVIEELNIISLVCSLREKYTKKSKRKSKKSRETDFAFQPQSSDKSSPPGLNEAASESVEVRPNFSLTEPIQITTSPGRRHKPQETQTITLNKRAQRNLLVKNLADVPSFPIPNNEFLSSKISTESNVTVLPKQFDLELPNSPRYSNDDQVLIKMSHDQDADIDNFSQSVEKNAEIRSPKSPPKSPLGHVSVEKNDFSDRSHMLSPSHSENKEKDEENIDIIVTEPVEEAYMDDFEEVSSLSILSGNSKRLESSILSKNDSMSKKKVEFSNPVVAEVNERDKVAKEEVEHLFYTHDESIRFENDYAKELEKAGVLGLSWTDWIEKRTDEDVLREEAEEAEAEKSYLEEVEEELAWPLDGDEEYGDEEFEIDAAAVKSEDDDPYDF